MLAAALVFGAMIGFGIALWDEVRRPRIADAHEIERATGVRVLGVIRPLLHPLSADGASRTATRHHSWILVLTAISSSTSRSLRLGRAW